MGSSLQKRQRNATKTKISIFNTRLQPSGSLENRWISEPITESSFKSFEDNFNQKIQNKLSESSPLTSAELLQLIKKESDDTELNFVTRHRPNNPELNKLKEVLQANTLKYTHINDTNSYYLYSRTIENLYTMVKAGGINPREVFDVYRKEVNGTYFLQGLKEIYEIVSAFTNDPYEADCLYQKFRNSSLKQFQKSQNKLKNILS